MKLSCTWTALVPSLFLFPWLFFPLFSPAALSLFPCFPLFSFSSCIFLTILFWSPFPPPSPHYFPPYRHPSPQSSLLPSFFNFLYFHQSPFPSFFPPLLFPSYLLPFPSSFLLLGFSFSFFFPYSPSPAYLFLHFLILSYFFHLPILFLPFHSFSLLPFLFGYCKCNFPRNSSDRLLVGLLAGRSVGLLVGRSVCHTYLKDWEVTLPRIYRSTYPSPSPSSSSPSSSALPSFISIFSIGHLYIHFIYIYTLYTYMHIYLSYFVEYLFGRVVVVDGNLNLWLYALNS